MTLSILVITELVKYMLQDQLCAQDQMNSTTVARLVKTNVRL